MGERAKEVKEEESSSVVEEGLAPPVDRFQDNLKIFW